VIDCGDSKLFTQAELEDAAEKIRAYFADWEGCELHSIRYAGDESCTEENLKWMNELNKNAKYAQVAEFLMDFHSPIEQVGTWTANAEYMDYEWWLARSADGSWDIVTFGY
jgi:D-alanyl-D-alanine carboxypeptidase